MGSRLSGKEYEQFGKYRLKTRTEISAWSARISRSDVLGFMRTAASCWCLRAFELPPALRPKDASSARTIRQPASLSSSDTPSVALQPRYTPSLLSVSRCALTQVLAMAKLIYTVLSSLDGYISDKNGNFDWASRTKKCTPWSMNSHATTVPISMAAGMYEVMAVWQTLPTHDQPSFIADFANIWRAADKVVYSKTLKTASTPRTHIEQHFEPEVVQRMKASAARDLAVGGPTLAAHAFKAGLVDVCHLFIAPIIVGDGNRAFQSDIRLEWRSRMNVAFATACLPTLPIINKPSHLTLACRRRLRAANCSCSYPLR